MRFLDLPRFVSSRAHRLEPSHLLLLFAIGATLIFSAFVQRLGYFGYDEAIYHLMVRAFDSSASVHLWNGYEEFPADGLVPLAVHVHDGKLAAQFPYLFGVIGAPFYRLFGFGGLILVNSLAYCATVALCVALAHRLFRDPRLSVAAGLIFVLATYSWQYAQAARPHAVAMLFIVASVYFVAWALDEPNRRRSAALAFTSGVMAGLAAGVRLDSIFVLSSVGIPLLLARPARLLQAVAAGLGAMPGLALLAYTHYLKFGVVNPFSYGYESKSAGGAVSYETYLPVVFAGLVGLLAVWGYANLKSSSSVTVAQRRLMRAFIALAALAGVWLAWPWLLRFAHGFYLLVVDLRIRDLMYVKDGLSRGPGGGNIYLGGLQKSFLQSCPYLVVLCIPLIYRLRGKVDPTRFAILFLAPATYVAAFSYVAWASGLVLHMRYFVSILPLTSILAAWAWREVTRDVPLARSHIWVLMVVIASLFAWLVLSTGYKKVDAFHEFALLTVPLVMAAVLFALSLLWAVGSDGRGGLRRIHSTIFTVCLIAALSWGGVVGFLYDFPRSLMFRKLRADIGSSIAPVVSPDSLVLALPHHNMMGVFSLDKVRLAALDPGNLRATRPLVAFHHRAGRPVYLWLQPILPDNVPPPRLSEIEAAFAPLRLTLLSKNKGGDLFRLSGALPMEDARDPAINH